MISRLQQTAFWFCCTVTSFACGSEPGPDWDRLAQHPGWLALLHYEQQGLSRTARSAVLDDDFFLAEAGRSDPKAELLATYHALNQGVSGENSAHCHFPARALWLSRHTDITLSSTDSCTEWRDWHEQHQDASVGLVFATGYLGNPASFFGHLLLHLDSGEASSHETGNRLLDTSLNFGADVPPEDGILVYMAKGLFGGYQAQFSHAPFYRNSTLYNEREMRDLWHYELNLDAWQTKLLTAHLFEIMGRQYRYRFLTENCASRIARLLDLFTDQPVSDTTAPWVDPESVIRNVNSATIDGKPAVTDITHIPSRRLITEHHFTALEPHEEAIATDLAANLPDTDFTSDSFSHLGEASQRRILEATGSYIAYRRSIDATDQLDEADQALLMARLRLPPGTESPHFASPAPVTDIPPGGRLQLKGVHQRDHGDALGINVRPMLYDLLESSTTRMPNAELGVLSSEWLLSSGKLSLQQLDLFSVTNLYNNPLPRPESANLSWHASAGWKQRLLDCAGCLDRHVTLLAGRSLETDNHLIYGMAGAQLRSEKHYQGAAAVAVQAGYLGHFNHGQTLSATLRHMDALSGLDSEDTVIDIKYRLALGQFHDLRIGFQTDTGTQRFEVGFSWYPR